MEKKTKTGNENFELLYEAIFRNLTPGTRTEIRDAVRSLYVRDLAFWTNLSFDRRGVQRGSRETGFADEHPTDMSLVFRIYLQAVLRMKGYIK